MPDLRCYWEFNRYVFYFCKWPVELRIPFHSISKNMNEVFISSLIGLNFHKRFCSIELPRCAIPFFLELIECLVDAQNCLHVLFAAEMLPDQKKIKEEGEIAITARPRKPSYEIVK